MLPMFRTAFEVSNFVSMVRERAKAIILLETPEAMMRIDEILSVGGIREIHFGLNDLHLGLKLHSRFEVL
jgi:2-keto-3-deoxy-L-rhamnonate aldolase RhmA